MLDCPILPNLHVSQIAQSIRIQKWHAKLLKLYFSEDFGKIPLPFTSERFVRYFFAPEFSNKHQPFWWIVGEPTNYFDTSHHLKNASPKIHIEPETDGFQMKSPLPGVLFHVPW